MSSNDNLSRRNFLKTSGLMGAGAILPIGRSRAGVVLKGLIPEERIIPGVSYWLTSTCSECSAGCGVKVRVREGNAVKIEGNEKHPINRDGLCARGQAALQGLYSPARIQSPLKQEGSGNLARKSWEEIGETLTAKLQELSRDKSKKIAVVTRQVTGGMQAMLEQGIADIPHASCIVHEPLEYAAMTAANKLCFGIEAIPTYDFSKAHTIVSFGADLFETWLSPVSNAYGFSESRKLDGNGVSRLIQFESHLSLTGANADQRYAVPPGSEFLLASAIASIMLDNWALPPTEIKRWREALKPFSVKRAADVNGISEQTIRQTAERLNKEQPSLAIAGGPGSRGPNATALQVVVNLINMLAGNYGETISFDRTENAPLGTHAQLSGLMAEMEAGRVAALVVNETNLEFALPQHERLGAAMKQVPLKIQLASVRDSSTDRFDFVLPMHHWLERWDLLEARSGLLSVQQPVIEPWCDSQHPGQVLSDILLAWGDSEESGDEYQNLLRGKWEQIRARDSSSDSFNSFWRRTLADGGHWSKSVSRKARLNPKATEIFAEVASTDANPGQMVLLPITTTRHGDGRQTGRPWLNELPDPITTIAWDAPMLISPGTAKKWECQSGDIVEIACGKQAIKAPVYIQAGTSDAVAAAPLGAPSEENVEYHFSADAHPLHRLGGKTDKRSGALVWTDTEVTFKRVVGKTPLARAQGHDRQDERGIAQSIAIADIGKKIEGKHAGPDPHKYDLYPKHEHPVHDWGMVIDLSACIGCGACAVGCQAENNVPVVGKDQCLLGRELAWLRIERFPAEGGIVFLPMLCQQCEHAPCETVCPVYASVHSSEGLNTQIYNRCVGTRYCANNCPYKVRRFNWYTYEIEPPLEKQINPDISIRTRGIMEKCTFCVQRIREHKEIAKDEERSLRDGEIVPACAQSCPTKAISFGDLNDPESYVSKSFKDPRGYTIFSKLNTQPSVVYLKRVYHGDSKPVKEL
jgi:molybdopterin-containing oxidoreductase family iron-sulfur binding subunit